MLESAACTGGCDSPYVPGGPMLAALWESVATGWARAGGGGLRAGALEAALRPLGRSAREVPSLVAPRLQPHVPRLQACLPRLQP